MKPMNLRSYLLATVVAVPGLIGCSSKSSPPAPVISNLDLPSTVSAGGVAMGTIDISDSNGLDDIEINITVTLPSGNEQSFPPMAAQGGSSMTSGTFQLDLELVGAPAGTYTVAVSVSEDGATSNTLTTMLTIQ
jgi:hypothetical protein